MKAAHSLVGSKPELHVSVYQCPLIYPRILIIHMFGGHALDISYILPCTAIVRVFNTHELIETKFVLFSNILHETKNVDRPGL
jgi:hypothetical protein